MEAFQDWITDHKRPFSDWIAYGIDALRASSTDPSDEGRPVCRRVPRR